MANVLEKLYVRVLWAIVALAKQSGCRLSRNPEFSLEQSKRTAEAIAERFYFPETGPLINDVLFHSEKKAISEPDRASFGIARRHQRYCNTGKLKADSEIYKKRVSGIEKKDRFCYIYVNITLEP